MSKSQFPKKRKLGCRTQLRAAAGAGAGGGCCKGRVGWQWAGCCEPPYHLLQQTPGLWTRRPQLCTLLHQSMAVCWGAVSPPATRVPATCLVSTIADPKLSRRCCRARPRVRLSPGRYLSPKVGRERDGEIEQSHISVPRVARLSRRVTRCHAVSRAHHRDTGPRPRQPRCHYL